ncbi:MAG TPA: hypothetical protein VGD45_01910 [Steroidobacter sp.]|uniref:hypothetical protein n=1 Tax=Steroidobacter sp. TaxID=1978227 RepID=UPI002ED82CBE
MTAAVHAVRIRAEVRELQKASAVIPCIECGAEYDNDGDGDLADALAVVRALVSAVCARIVRHFQEIQKQN